MGTNNLKLKISEGVQNVLIYYLPVKSHKVSLELNILFLIILKMAAKRHVEILILELFDIYFNV